MFKLANVPKTIRKVNGEYIFGSAYSHLFTTQEYYYESSKTKVAVFKTSHPNRPNKYKPGNLEWDRLTSERMVFTTITLESALTANMQPFSDTGKGTLYYLLNLGENKITSFKAIILDSDNNKIRWASDGVTDNFATDYDLILVMEPTDSIMDKRGSKQSLRFAITADDTYFSGQESQSMLSLFNIADFNMNTQGDHTKSTASFLHKHMGLMAGVGLTYWDSANANEENWDSDIGYRYYYDNQNLNYLTENNAEILPIATFVLKNSDGSYWDFSNKGRIRFEKRDHTIDANNNKFVKNKTSSIATWDYKFEKLHGFYERLNVTDSTVLEELKILDSQDQPTIIRSRDYSKLKDLAGLITKVELPKIGSYVKV